MRTLEVDWTVERAGGATLVGVELENRTQTPRRVRVENLLDGDVLPPRREGVPEEGWDADGYGGVVAAGARLAVGYACRGEPVCPPVDVTDEGRADGGPVDPSPAELTERAIRELGTPRPPAAAVPVPEAETDAGDAETTGGGAGPVVVGDAETVGGGDVDSVVSDGDDSTDSDGDDSTDSDGDDSTDSTPPEAETPASHATVDEWLDGVERRVELGERFTDASVVDATEALSLAGGLGGTEALARRLADDPERLRAVARRAARLAARAEVVDVPVEALRRLS